MPHRMAGRVVMYLTAGMAYIIAGLFAGVLGFWTQERDLPAHTIRAEILTPVVRPGEDLLIQWTVYRNRRGCSAYAVHILRDMMGQRQIIERYAPSILGAIGEDQFISRYQIPTTFTDGRATHRLTRSYQCNPIHAWWPIVEETKEHVFKIKGAPVDASPVEIVPR